MSPAVRDAKDAMPDKGPCPVPADVVQIGSVEVEKYLPRVRLFAWALVSTGVAGLFLLAFIAVEIRDIRVIESNRSGYQQATIDVLCEIRDGKRYTKEK